MYGIIWMWCCDLPARVEAEIQQEAYVFWGIHS